MKLKSQLIRPYANYIARREKRRSKRAVSDQQRILRSLLYIARNTSFGKDHQFDKIDSHKEYCERVPIRDYEGLKQYIDMMLEGEEHVLWPGRPMYLAKTSGTTSGIKYIPITRDSINNHFYTAQTALMLFMAESKRYDLMDGNMIFLSGSPELNETEGVPTGRLSGIVNHQVPSYLKGNQVPSWETNCIDDWEEKVAKIVEETADLDMRLISGIPPWVQMYFDLLVEKSGKPVGELFPNFTVFVYGGVNYEPYRAKLEETIGKRISSVETYPASEGFIAFQDSQTEPGLLLNTDSGIFFEFVPAAEIFDDQPTRLTLEEVEAGVNYAIIITSNAGLWAYNIGDTVKFVSTDPYRIVVTGRIKHFISAFGEHVIGKEVEAALLEAAQQEDVGVTEFSVAPMIDTVEELPYHQWLVEFEKLPEDLEQFAQKVDQHMCEQNIYYKDLIDGKVLQPLKITVLGKGTFINYMKSQGKLGGQNKVPRLSNNRDLAEQLLKYSNN